ncbi:MAG: endonuclease MutS2 [Lachnospiraceae bacterium]|nr:endonuclease MutS2 [Lachnospiraceae bacterium]
MNKKVLKTLEYDKIVKRLSALATSDMGRNFCEKISPQKRLSDVTRFLTQTDDALSRVIKYGSLSFSGARDITEYARRLEIGGTLGMAELLHVAGLLNVADRAKKYGIGDERGNEISDSLSGFFEELVTLDAIKKEISRVILSEDEMADDASPELLSIRRSLSKAGDRIRSVLNEMLSKQSIRDGLTEAVITTRNGRYCLPVRSDYKSQIPGMVHDQSSSGMTLFIEPQAVVNLNNEVRELELKEKEELGRILAELSARVAEHTDELKNDLTLLSRLDFIFAKAALALEMNAVRPEMANGGVLVLKKARHPLLDQKTVVPIDVTLGEDFHQLIITGPNTGGKTVALKTVGLLSLMGQSGLLIPTASGSRLPFFDEIYADIGDEQSIEQSLSTFSSHMTNIVSILKGLDKSEKGSSLVLFDELCSGTDPTEGAALAVAILDRVRNCGALSMATTHYAQLKLYALSTEDVENGSCEFDVKSLMPTYRLLVGVPGKSNAFAISKRLGLPREIITAAEGTMNEEDRSFEDILTDIEISRANIERDRRRIQSERAEIENLKKNAKDKQEKMEARRDKIIAEANEKAANILRDAKEQADAAIRNIHKYGEANPDMSKMEQERQKLGKKLSSATEKSMEKKGGGKHVPPKASDLHVGDMVRVVSMGLTGTVHTLPDSRDEVDVQMGIMHSKVKLSDLELIPEEGAAKKKNSGKVARGAGAFSKAASISPELMLIGMTVDEAVMKLEKYIDDACLSHLTQVRIVHGKGTGALRNAVHDSLKRNRLVTSYRLGEFGEGDAGVTIVEL